MDRILNWGSRGARQEYQGRNRKKLKRHKRKEMLRGRGTADERRYFLKGWRKRDQTQNINLGFLSFHWLSAGKVEDLSNRVSLESIFIAFNNFKPSNRLARS